MSTQTTTSGADYLADLKHAALQFPAADGDELIIPLPNPPIAHRWDWEEMRRLLVMTADTQGVLPQGQEGAERRILRLKNPGTLGDTVTDTFSVSVQYLLPGEIARAHRHTPVAFRFFIEGNAYTTVNGEKCSMTRGDLVITPSLEWHGHGNESDGPAIWMDGIDFPLVRTLNAIVYERSDEPEQTTERSGISERRFSTVGLRPGWDDGELPTERRSLLHFRWERTWEYLQALAAAGEASPTEDVFAEFVNPATGGSVFPTIGCYVQMIRPGIETAHHRTTGAAVFHVFEGEGETVIGDERFAWKKGDFLVVPSYAWHHHVNKSADPAILFSIRDTPTLKALGLYREQIR